MNLLRGARFFLAIHEEGRFGLAATRLGITQPPLSQGLKRFEAALGVSLLQRGPGGVSLTPAGASVLPLVRTLLAAEDELRAAAAALAAASSEVRLGVLPELPDGVVAGLAAVDVAGPDTEVHLQTASSAAIVEEVQRHRLDVGIVEHPAVLGDLSGGDVVLLPTWLLVPAGGAVDGPLRRLVTRPLAVTARSDAPAARDLLADTLLQHGVTHGTVTVADDRAALALVAGGRACALTADPEAGAPAVARVPLGIEPLPLRLRVIHRAGDTGAAEVAERIERHLRASAEP
ncbi:LysR family transcriptional regulator [Iamia sp. SCSIO 61187]|uniref:LysR family transcriptional regulator n=1 Tax=Iamia sp. SCSIO 61187 TaxID=2722752 RepID=UPI001C6362AD|nr:LysR family transcriptional regulator [Iamia sp. SCSIO 61187]QYG95176.1 LysR family transcriptional regulator [Iamia sp. SCSIO 61187]